jgi:hypothetical protein
MSNLTYCNHCAGKIVLSLGEHHERGGLKFCCEECADGFFSRDNPEPYPIGLAHDLGVEE